MREAHVLQQGYRPGGLDALGFGPEALAAMRPGLVCVSLSAYGHAGPWASRRGFDSLVQTATGFNDAEARAAGVAGGLATSAPAFDDLRESADSGFGRLEAIRHAVRHDGAPTAWARPSMPPGAHPPSWAGFA